MKLNIAICDDNSVHVDLIKSYIESMNIPYEVNCILTYSGEELLHKLKHNTVDVVFLDIEMKGLNGIQTGRKIREEYKDAIIVYLTGYKNYTLEAFEIESFHYLIKPIVEEKFKSIMERILIRFKEIKAFKEKMRIFSIQRKDKLIKLKYDDIYCFEKYFRKIRLHTLDQTIEFYGSMKDLLYEIDESYFIRCHQSYVVNRDKIREIQGNIIILKGKEKWPIPISRTYKQDVVNMFYENLFKNE